LIPALFILIIFYTRCQWNSYWYYPTYK